MSSLNQLILEIHHMDVHDKIRTIRTNRGYSQSYMAIEIGIDTANYGRMERGQTKITIDRLKQISNILEIDIKDLILENNQNDLSLESTLFKNHQTEMKDSLLKILNEIKKINEHLKSFKK